MYRSETSLKLPIRFLIRRCLILLILAAAFFFASWALNQPAARCAGDETEWADSGDADIPVFEEDWSMDDDFSMGEDASNFTWRTELAFENLFNTRREEDFDDAYKKNEISARFEFTYGTSRTFLKSITDVYVMPTFINGDIGDDYVYSEDTDLKRNLRVTGRESEINFRELYFNYPLGNGHIRAGNQIYAWGTADFVNATAYINPRDLRELLFIDEDHLKLGVPSVSGMVFFDRFTLELVWVPVHVAAAIPPTGNFWSVREVDNDYPVFFDESKPVAATAEHFGYSARISSSYKGMDFSFSGYHGPDTEPLFRPVSTVLVPNEPVGVRVRPYYDVVNYVGFDFSTTRGDFVFQAEGAYSPNKSGYVDPDGDNPIDIDFPLPVERSDYFAYSIGFNYFIPMHQLLPGHAGDSLFTMEWFQAEFLDRDLNEPVLSHVLTTRYQDEFFDKRIHVSLTGIFELRDGGVIFWPQLAYDFQNGFKLELDYAAIDGEGKGDFDEDATFYYYRKNDFIMVTLRYAYP